MPRHHDLVERIGHVSPTQSFTDVITPKEPRVPEALADLATIAKVGVGEGVLQVDEHILNGSSASEGEYVFLVGVIDDKQAGCVGFA